MIDAMVCALLHFLVLLLIPPAWGADVPPRLSIEQLTAQSDAIVSGRVIRTWAAMDSENRFIWTHYEIRVHDTLKGSARSTIVISEPGGVLNGVFLQVSGSTRYADGEEVAVFLYRTPIGYLRTTNYGQGKFNPSSWSVFRARVASLIADQKAVDR
jgi:hypothetical protein